MPPRILLAPDKFRFSLTATQAAAAMAEGIARVSREIEVDLCPMADGGEGTVAALVAATMGTFHTASVTSPLPERKVQATFGILGDGRTAVIEMSAASGLALLTPAERDPMFTTTFGTGELLSAAAKLGAGRAILGIGGSATIDGGIGCAQACGLPVLLEEGEPVSLTEPLVGGDLSRVVLIKHGRGSSVDRLELTVACDVRNPLFGKDGAARAFGAQKGATPEQIRQLDAWLEQLARRCNKLAEAHAPGAGAAGGLGFAMLAFFGAKLVPGANLVMEHCRLRDRLKQADLCITGEGRLDASSGNGKVTGAVSQACRELGVPCWAIVGSVETSPADEATSGKLLAGFERVIPIQTADRPIEQTLRHAAALVADAAENAVRQFMQGLRH